MTMSSQWNPLASPVVRPLLVLTLTVTLLHIACAAVIGAGTPCDALTRTLLGALCRIDGAALGLWLFWGLLDG